LFELGLSGQLWPVHGKPYEDEVLSSWLVRLSRAYGAEPTRFCAQIWPHHAVWSRDMDHGTDHEVLQVLTAKTATPRARVLATTVRGYRGYRPEDLRRLKRPPWLLRLGLHSFTRSRPWLQYCPQCLREDVDPYFRRCWRLAFVTVCPTHARRLLDRCEACGAVVNFHRLPGDAETMTQCHGCWGDLRGAQAPTLRRIAEDHRVVQFQTFLLTTMRTGTCRVTGANAIPGARFFGMLHRRVRIFLAALYAPAFQEAFGAYGPSRWLPSDHAGPAQRSIEGLGVEDRFKLMRFVSWWFGQWLAPFLRRAAEAQLGEVG
jgi:TniQ